MAHSDHSKLGATPNLKYFDLLGFGGLAGRGGVLRFFFLQNGIAFTDEKVSMPEWGKGPKQAVIESGENPFGTVPIVTLGDKTLVQSHSTSRYLAKKLGLYGSDPDRDYQVDILTESAADWRAAWASSAFGDDAAKAKYKDETRPSKLKTLETLMARAKASGSHTVGSQASSADSAVFTQLWDDEGVFGAVPLDAYPHVKAFYEAFHALPAVKEWCDAARPTSAA